MKEVLAGAAATALSMNFGAGALDSIRPLNRGRPTIYVKSVHPRRGQSMAKFQMAQWAKIREQQTANFSCVEDVHRAIRRFERYATAHPQTAERHFPRHIRERYKQALAVKAGMRELAKQVSGQASKA